MHKSPDGAVHTDLKVLYLDMGTGMASQEMHSSCYFCEAFSLNFNLHLTLSISNHVSVKLILVLGFFKRNL